MKLVSAILPTRGRRDWAREALRCFMNQTYEPKELVILDDAEELSFPNESIWREIPGRVFYLAARVPLSIAEKRNEACRIATGKIIIHWDSDDWSAPDRMTDQVYRLQESGKQVTGYHSLLFRVEHSGQWWKYVGDPSDALGTSLCYLKAFWEIHPFRPGRDHPNVGEDNEFVKDARQAGELVSVDAEFQMFARIHDGNTSPKKVDGAQACYRPVPLTAIPEGFPR